MTRVQSRRERRSRRQGARADRRDGRAAPFAQIGGAADDDEGNGGVNLTATMSAAMNWPNRMPASKPCAARSTVPRSRRSPLRSRDKPGKRARSTAPAGRQDPARHREAQQSGRPPSQSRATSLAATSSSKAGLARDRNRSPASVRPTLRVVRMKSAAPRRASSVRPPG